MTAPRGQSGRGVVAGRIDLRAASGGRSLNFGRMPGASAGTRWPTVRCPPTSSAASWLLDHVRVSLHLTRQRLTRPSPDNADTLDIVYDLRGQVLEQEVPGAYAGASTLSGGAGTMARLLACDAVARELIEIAPRRNEP